MKGFISAMAAFVSASSVVGPAWAGEQWIDGNQLLEWCEKAEVPDPLADPLFGACAGYVAGVVDTVERIKLLGLFKNWSCIPDQVTLGQLAGVTGKYLKDNPAERHFPADVLVMDAVSSAYPCQ